MAQLGPGAQEEIEATVRRTVREIGYEQDGFHWEKLRFDQPSARPVRDISRRASMQRQQG
jgi:S-adenosylmethionine synthetase